MKKINILLGAYIDSVNAQNINCYYLAKYLDEDIYNIITFHHSKKNIQKDNIISYKIYKNKILKNLQKFLIMVFSRVDIYYLPRIEKIDIFFARLFGKSKCIVSSIEIENIFLNNSYVKFFNYDIFNFFCISETLKNKVTENWGKTSEILYLGCEQYKKNDIEFIGKLKRIVFIGSITERKRPQLYLEIAKKFPELQFDMIGNGEMLETIKKYILENSIQNVICYGGLSNKSVIEKLAEEQLLIITSKSEGLPKVILEAASMGVPTIYFNELYQVDYIKNGINGFEVQDLNEMCDKILFLINNENYFKNMREMALQISKDYDWKKLIKKYNKYFMSNCKTFNDKHK